MSRRFATALAAAVLGGALASVAGPAARAQPTAGTAAAGTVSDEAAAAAVRILDVTASVRTIDTTVAVISLRTEQRRGTEVTVTINSDVLFGFDSADLTESARREVATLADRIRGATGVVRVDGYTDGVGTPDYNLALSQRRANAVADALRPATGAGVSVSGTGHGAADPVAPNTKPDGSDDPAGRALNRRVTVTFQTA